MGGVRRAVLTAALGVGIGTLPGALPGTADALEPAAQRGQAFVKQHCATCHAVGRADRSPLAEAPPFRTLHRKYAVDDLAESLAEGITTGHPTMPEFRLDPGQVTDLIAYLKTLER